MDEATPPAVGITPDELDDIALRLTQQCLNAHPAENVTVSREDIGKLVQHVLHLELQINSPHTECFLLAVRLEAVHQRERWGVDRDAGKEPPDWFWLLGYLAGKALKAAVLGDKTKALHHTVSSAAVLLNWHAHLSGVATAFRPGIDPPEGTDG